MQALYSLFLFMSFRDRTGEQVVDDWEDRFELVANHGDDIAHSLHRCLISNDNSTEERLIAAQLAAFMTFVSLDAQRSLEDAGLSSACAVVIEKAIRADPDDEPLIKDSDLLSSVSLFFLLSSRKACADVCGRYWTFSR